MAVRYYLKNKETGYIETTIVIEKADYYSVDATCYQAYSWYGDDHMPCEYHYVAGAYCKWDGCTHWYFYGEDYDPEIEESEKDSYYHLCGPRRFTDHIRAMCFMWKVVSDVMTELAGDRYSDYKTVQSNYFECEDTKKLVDMMLDGYEILKESNDDGKQTA